VRSVTSQREISLSVGLLGRNLMDYRMMPASDRGVAARAEKKTLDELEASDIICVRSKPSPTSTHPVTRESEAREENSRLHCEQEYLYGQ
jgi:hypothetical protein